MKNINKIFISLLLMISIFPFMTVSADTSPESESVDQLISELIYYFGEDADTDILRTLDLMKERSIEDYDIWRSVMEEWSWIEDDMVENIDVAPDGLPTDDKHAFVVLGFALNDDGTMRDELIGRLEVALRSAEKYPNSYVLVTGGVEKNGWTEGDRMHDWLVNHGLPEDRIIVENESSTTVENAANSFEILYNDYDIATFSMITSQYHLKRGSIFYYTMSQLKAKELGEAPIEFIGEGNAGWFREDKTEEPLSLKVRGMYQIAGVNQSNDLPISVLEDLVIEGNLEYNLFEDLNLDVYAEYDNGYTRDVTELSSIVGFDPNELGEQEIEISYEEKDNTVTKNIQVTVVEPSLESVQQLVENLHDQGEIHEDDAARLLSIHLTAVKQFEDTGQTDKVLKHLNNFENLLDYQQNEELISDEAYDILKRSTQYLLEESTQQVERAS